MKNNKLRNIILIAGTLITAVLAVVVIIISTQLQQRGSEPVAPNVPSSQPQAAELCTTSFIVEPAVAGVAACQAKLAFRDITTNTPGKYDTLPANRIPANATVSAGMQFVYQLQGTTLTSDTAGPVVWTDVLDSRLEYVDGDSQCVSSVTGGVTTVTCGIRGARCPDRNIVAPEPGDPCSRLLAGDDYTVAFRVRVKTPAAVGSIVNSAIVSTGDVKAAACGIAVAIPPGSCNNTCSTTADCSSGLTCNAGRCRNTACTTETSCVCPIATPTPTPTPTPTATPTPTPTATPTPPPGSTGFYIIKYNDLNADGLKQSTEVGLDWDFEWDLNGDNNWRAYVTTDTDGGKGGNISNLKGGDKVRIKEKSKEGWSSTTSNQVDITLVASEIKKIEFGNTQKTAVGCNNSCTSNSDCASGLACSNGTCRNNACSAKTNCVCDVTSTATPTTTVATATPAPSQLPAAGSTAETFGVVAVGIVITILGVIGLFAL